MNIAIRVDAGFHIGTGHVMRCLTLAHALRERGDSVMFITRDHAGSSPDALEAAGFPVRLLPNRAGAELKAGPPHAAWLGVPADEDAAETLKHLADGTDWVIVDHYSIDRHWESQLRSSAKRILVIDDLADRAHDCDLLVDPTLGREAADYTALVSGDAKVLTGTDYALLRPAFARRRTEALARRAERAGRLERLFVSFGSLDPDNHTADACAAIRRALPEARIDIVLGGNAPHLDSLAKTIAADSRIELHVGVDAEQMAGHMIQADLGIGAAGSTAWERCCMGLPAIVVVAADNQRRIAAALEEAGAVISLGALKTMDTQRLASLLQHLGSNGTRLEAMSQAADWVCDGRGTGRVCEVLLS